MRMTHNNLAVSRACWADTRSVGAWPKRGRICSSGPVMIIVAKTMMTGMEKGFWGAKQWSSPTLSIMAWREPIKPERRRP